jgi:hypothetical protein
LTDTQARQALPERAELLPGIWRLPLPLRDSPLGHVNTYLVRADNGYLLVDSSSPIFIPTITASPVGCARSPART